MWSWLSGSYETFPVPSAFSSPPIRCSRPGVPGIARPRQRLRVAEVRQETALVVRSIGEAHRNLGVRLEVGDQPRLRAVREVGVREQEDGRPVLERDPGGLDRGVEAAARRRGGDHRQRRLGVPAPHREEVGLLGLGRHPRGRACPLDVDHERQLERQRGRSSPSSGRSRGRSTCRRRARRRSSHRVRRRRRRSRPPPGRSGRRSPCGAKVLEDLRRRRDRVGAEEER